MNVLHRLGIYREVGESIGAVSSQPSFQPWHLSCGAIAAERHIISTGVLCYFNLSRGAQHFTLCD